MFLILIEVVVAIPPSIGRFSSNFVKTWPIYYFMLLEYMRKVSKILTIQNPRKLSLKKKFKKRLNTEFRILREN